MKKNDFNISPEESMNNSKWKESAQAIIYKIIHKKESKSGNDSQGKSKGRKIRIRHIVLSFASVLLVCAILVSIYVWRLLDTPVQTDVPIVTGGEVSEGILDHLPDTDATEAANSSSSNEGNASAAAITWGNGRVKLYVNANFPITKVAQRNSNVENILIIGVDARSAYETQSRTDSIMMVSIDRNNNSIKMTSFMRDTRVKIPGRTVPTKINSAYEFGGIGLLINTMNLTFDLDIQKFGMVDMLSAENIVNAAGGVTINVTKNEVGEINQNVSETNYLFRKFSAPSPSLAKSGEILLDGRQAVAYGRIRSIGTDTARTQRQRTILTALITSFKASTVSNKMKTFEAALQTFETNMTKSDMLFLSFDVLSAMKNIQQYRVPENGMYTTNLSNYQLVIDFAKQLPALHQFIWGSYINNSGTMSGNTSESVSSDSSPGSGSPSSSSDTDSNDSSSGTGSTSESSSNIS